MNTQTSFPVFESGQVLTSAHLNDLVEYLEQEDRRSRAKLIGVGVVCGFEVDVDSASRLRISGGVATTTHGYLIADGPVICDRAVPYETPVPSGEGVSAQQIAEARYPYLYLDGVEQIEAWELMQVGDAPRDGSEVELETAFLSDKTVMLYLECDLQSLKSCDINDCSDKGAEMNFTLRRLLVRRADADAMLARESDVASVPVDRATHPRLDLPRLRVEKLNPGGAGIRTFPMLFARIQRISTSFLAQLEPALSGAFAAYRYLLKELFPESDFPNGAFGSPSYFSNVLSTAGDRPFLIQHLYDYLLDVARGYNEFVQAAARFDAECLPEPQRFPKHVLLGDARRKPHAFGIDRLTAADLQTFDPATASTGLGPSPRPERRRHHFVPSPALGRGAERLAEVRSLFYRLTLLAHAFDSRELLGKEVRVTPSRDGAAPLAERAIPFYYAAPPSSDLFRNWSFAKTRTNRLSQIYSYVLNPPDGEHPLWFRIDDQDFYRVEGLVGKPLGSTMARLIRWKREQGLDFGIEPVWMGMSTPDNQGTAAIDVKARQAALAAVRKLLLCRMGDLEVIFLMLMGALFYFLFALVGRLARLDATRAASGQRLSTPAPAPAPAPTEREVHRDEVEGVERIRRNTELLRLEAASLEAARLVERFRPIGIDPQQEKELRRKSDVVLDEFRRQPPPRGQVTETLGKPDRGPVPPRSIAAVYAAVKDEAAGGDLFSRTKAHVESLRLGDAEQNAVDSAYAAVSLVDQAETLMAAASVPSLADFDPEQFSASYRGFADAYLRYADRSAVGKSAGAEAAKVNSQVRAEATLVEAAVPFFAGGGFFAEISKRLLSLFEELTLHGYATRHPGLEHRCGVPVGGTLVLAYVSKAELLEALEAMAGRFAVTLRETGGTADARRAVEDLQAASASRSEDPLDEFVVLADFCLPHRCCDADCSDLEIADRIGASVFEAEAEIGPMSVQPLIPGDAQKRPGGPLVSLGAGSAAFQPIIARGLLSRSDGSVVGIPLRREARPFVTVHGAVRSGAEGGERGGRVESDARVRLELPDGSSRTLETRRGRYELWLPPGNYKLRAQKQGFRGKTTELKVRAGHDSDELELDLELTRVN